MTYGEIERYLYDGCVVRNEEFEYKKQEKDIFCREIGIERWENLHSIGKYGKEIEWEIVSC